MVVSSLTVVKAPQLGHCSGMRSAIRRSGLTELLLLLVSALWGMWFVVAATLGEEGFAFAMECRGYSFTQHPRFGQQVIKMPERFPKY